MILSHHKTKWNQPKLQKVYMQATVSILCILVRVYTSLTYRTQFNHSKLRNLNKFIINGQNDHKTAKSFFHKINKNVQRKTGLKCFLHSRA